MTKFSVLLLGGCLMAGMAFAQNEQPEGREIHIAFGINGSQEVEMQEKVDGLLTALNHWQQDGSEAFSDDPGVEAFKQIAEAHQLVARDAKITVGAYQVGDLRYFTPIYLSNQSMQDQRHGVSLVFNEEGVLVDARQIASVNTVFRFSAQAIPVKDTDTYGMLAGVLKSYRETIQKKQSDAFEALFAEDADIISGTWNPDDNAEEYTYRRQPTDKYVAYIAEQVFHPENQIQLLLSGTNYYRDIENPDIYLISTYQIWHSSYYSDGGQLLLLVDTSEKSPKITARFWFERDLKLDGFYPKDVNYTFSKNPVRHQQVQGDDEVKNPAPKSVALRKSSHGETKPKVDEAGSSRFFTKKRLWILGGVAAGAAASSAILLTRDGGSGIPIPPGRPVAN